MKQTIWIALALIFGVFIGTFYTGAVIDTQKSHIELLETRISFLQEKVFLLQMQESGNTLVN